MDREFIEDCRLLKKHFTKLTQADTTAESVQKSTSPDVVADIINESKQLLFYEQLEALSDQDIKALRQNSVTKYAKKLDNCLPRQSCRKSLCQKNSVHWNDDIFRSPPPNPKWNLKFDNSNLHTILECQTDNKENDEECFFEYSDDSQMTFEDEITELRKECEEHASEGRIIDDEIKAMKEQCAKHYRLQNKTMKHEYEKYYKVDEEIEAMRKECVEMETMMMKKHTRKSEIKGKEAPRNVVGSKQSKIEAKVEKEIRFIEGTVLKNKVDGFHATGKKEEEKSVLGTREVVLKVDEFKSIPELKIIPQQKSDIVQLLEVKKLQIETLDNQTFDATHVSCHNINAILRSTLKKWRNYAKNNKINRAKSNNKKIENFLENIQKFKLSNSQKSKSDLNGPVKDKKHTISVKAKPKSSGSLENKVSSFEYRFQAQKDIIARQKAKLEEQNKVIEELKLNRIHKQAKESMEKAQSELQKAVQLSTKYKYRLKPEQKPVIEDTVVDPIGVSFSLNLCKAPKMVQMMEERAIEREEKRMLIKERKRLIEEEKKRTAEEAIQRKLREESDEKQQRVERMRRQRELARQLEIQRQLEKKRFIAINQIAYEHYRRQLMKNYGMKHFRMLVYKVKINLEIGKRFYETTIVMRCYKAWKTYARRITVKKNSRAVSLYEYKVKLKSMNAWRKVHFKAVQRNQVAVDRYEMSLQNKIFVYWHRLVCEYHIQYTINAQKAEDHYKRVLVFQCLHYWRSLPEIMKIERMQNERKRKWRLRVAEILSDYDPLQHFT